MESLGRPLFRVQCWTAAAEVAGAVAAAEVKRPLDLVPIQRRPLESWAIQVTWRGVGFSEMGIRESSSFERRVRVVEDCWPIQSWRALSSEEGLNRAMGGKEPGDIDETFVLFFEKLAQCRAYPEISLGITQETPDLSRGESLRGTKLGKQAVFDPGEAGVFCSDPDFTVGAFGNGGDGRGRKALGFSIRAEPGPVEAVDAAAIGCDPDVSFAIFTERLDLVAGKAV